MSSKKNLIQPAKYITYKTGVLVVRNTKVLLIREEQPDTGKMKWNIIKGTVEPKDLSFSDAAAREVFEEVGLHVKPRSIINIARRFKRPRPVIQINFLATSKNGRPTLKPPSYQRKKDENIIEAKFFTRTELKKLKLSEYINDRAYQAIQLWVKRK